MARVRQWLPAFLKRHQIRFNPHDWPKMSEAEEYRVFTEMWIASFATREITEAEAAESREGLFKPFHETGNALQTFTLVSRTHVVVRIDCKQPTGLRSGW